MDIKTYRNEYGTAGLREVAAAVGSSYAYLSQLAHGHRRASAEFARRLEEKDPRQKLTRDAIRPDLFGPINEKASA